MSEQLSPEMQDYIRAFMQREWARMKQEEEEKKGDLLTVQATADLFKVHIQTVQAWKRQGLIVAHKMGRRTYFKKTELIEVLKANKIKMGKEARPAVAPPAQPELFAQAPS